MIRVLVPSQLHAYTGGVSRLEAEGAAIADVLDDLDRRFPGLKFRIIDEQDRVRPHMRLFVGKTAARDIRAPVSDGDELLIFGALSGG
ncbi:MAG TPA: MoaD/ThiS family protein [Caulobacteraceae bacterium]|nr:MoaD/ThiS family protein [Caulobacteraceae bacterium]